MKIFNTSDFKQITLTYRTGFWLLFAATAITYIAFLGFSFFNTKGEPREAIVAVSMLESGNWILPLSNGVDIPYKPPMLAWCIALLSEIFNGGHVTEFLSRLPSALAGLIMVMSVYKYCARYRNASEGMLTAVLLMTSFEVHRAATSCRVDMLLTMFMVVAMLMMFDRIERGKRLISLPVILLLSGAVLTKGPVGVILPLLVVWVTALVLKRRKFWTLTLVCILTGILSLILPAVWYYLAIEQGGQDFVNLVLEENFGRFTGSMSYESHVNPWPYNFVTILAGMLPYSILVIPALFLIPRTIKYFREHHETLKTLVADGDPWRIFMFVTFVVIFIFYCFPASKRSVYLLPLYPAAAWGTVLMARRVARLLPKSMKIWCVLIAIIALALPATYVAVHNLNPAVTSRSMRNAIQGLHDYHAGGLGLTTAGIAALLSAFFLLRVRRMRPVIAFHFALAIMVPLYWSFSSIYQPAILNAKSDRATALAIEQIVPEGAPLYSTSSVPMLRYYTVDFYLNDRVTALPVFGYGFPEDEFYLIVGRKDLQSLHLPLSRSRSAFQVIDTYPRSCDTRQEITLIKVGKSG